MTATMTRRASWHRYIQEQPPGVVSFSEPSTGILQMGGHARAGASHIPRPVKILPGVPYPGHPTPRAAARHRSRGSLRPVPYGGTVRG